MSLAISSPPISFTIGIVDHPLVVWSRVHHWVEAAIDAPTSLMSAADVFQQIVSGSMKLWTIHDRDELVGCFVTKIEAGSLGRALNIIALGGAGMTDWIALFDEAVTKYASANGCRFVFEMGRSGWRRVFGALGWVDGPATMVKVL